MVQVAQAQAGQPFPKGDELGDVGQYYSVLSPRKGSATYIQNTSASSQTVNVAIYQDTGGSPVETLVCTVPGNRTLQIDMIDDSGTGTLDVEGYSGGANCGDKTGYHGVYHMKIWSGGNLAVTVRHVIGPAGAYWAVADKFADDYHLLPGIYLCDGSGCWDTEFVVQNTTGTTTNVHFSWNPDDEAGFYDNNEAQLDGNERRSFLASQLMLANTGGGALTQKDFWTVFHLYASGGVEVAVTVNMFYRAYSDGKLKAENPVKHLMQFTTPEVGDVLLFPVSRTINFIRVANACSTTKSVSATSYDINGNANGSTNINLGAFKGGTINPASFNASSTIYSVKLSTSGACIAGWMWHVDTGGYMGITGQEDGDTGSVFFPTHVSGSSLNQGYAHSQVNQYTNTNSSPSRTAYYMDDGTTYTSGSLTLNGDFDHQDTTVTDFPEEFYQRIDKGTGNLFGEASYVHQLGSADNEWAYSGISAVDDTWYVPFAMAPVVEFHDTGKAGYAGTSKTSMETALKQANWYDWDWTTGQGSDNCSWYDRDFNRANVTNLLNGKSLYIPMWKGIVHPTWIFSVCADSQDLLTAAFNSETRMKVIRNIVPSYLAGRPLLLSNEPDLGGGQAWMTYPELARSVFVVRNWPGELFSPAFAHATYSDLLDNGDYHSAGYSEPCSTSSGCGANPYVNLIGLESYYEGHKNSGDENSFSGLGFDLYGVLDGIAFHTYDYGFAHKTYLNGYKSLAANRGVDLWLTEYSASSYLTYDYASLSACQTAQVNNMTNMHNWIDNELAPDKIFWFTGDERSYSNHVSNPSRPNAHWTGTRWEWELCSNLYGGSTLGTTSVGDEWIDQTQ